MKAEKLLNYVFAEVDINILSMIYYSLDRNGNLIFVSKN